MSGIEGLDTHWKHLIEKYVTNTCTREELDELLQMVEREENRAGLNQALKDYWLQCRQIADGRQPEIDKQFFLLMEQAKTDAPPLVTLRHYSWKTKRGYLAAAITIGIFLTATYFLFKPLTAKQAGSVQTTRPVVQDVAPGQNKAILTLANGSTIILDSAHNGTLTTQGSTSVHKTNGALSYSGNEKSSGLPMYNSVATPRGGQYKLVLSDGTRVWLNAASSIRFPANFTGKERNVELIGEAYFEVAKNAARPFRVSLNGATVEVLGTHFNINSYFDESAIAATLLEGSIKINKDNGSGILKPGQQALINKSGELKIVDNADVDEAIAWKDGNFQFTRADIFYIMRQLQRWYDVDVEYNGSVAVHFVGTIPRTVNLSQVLHMLELTGKVNFTIEDKKIIVMPTKR